MLGATLTVSGLMIAWNLGWIEEIWSQDASGMSLVIAAVFWTMSILGGVATWKACRGMACRQDCLAYENALWFSSEISMALGMVGTIVGFVLMLSGFRSLDVSNPSSVQSLLGDLGGSMGTALYTTLVGLVGAILLKIQAFNLGREIGKQHGIQ